MAEGARSAAGRVVAALEDIEMPLRNVAAIVRGYTIWLFNKLQESVDAPADRTEEARRWIERWRHGEVLRDELLERLKAIGQPAIAPVADLLFDSLEAETPERPATEMAIDVLGNIRSSASSRILAHAIAEPALEEDLEQKAFEAVLRSWPLPRPYILSQLQSHAHEDLPYRWFQVLIEANEIYGVDLMLEEFSVHGNNPVFQADLVALSRLLHQSRDPECEEKILQMLNAPETAPPAAAILENVLKSREPVSPLPAETNPWRRLAHLRAVNRRYIEAAKLFDTGRKSEALAKINAILEDEPRYPLAVMLKSMM
jgi:hypothetical protein